MLFFYISGEHPEYKKDKQRYYILGFITYFTNEAFFTKELSKKYS